MTERENQIIVYQPNETVRLDLRLENETVWLTQEQMALLFGRDQSVIACHDQLEDKELYLIGASLKGLGEKCFAFTKLDAGEIERIKKSAFGAMKS